MIIFEHILILLLLPLPWIMRALLPKAQAVGGAALRVPFFNDVREVAGRKHSSKIKHPLAFRLLVLIIWILLVSAAANPQHIGEPVSIRSEARDLMLAVDVSGSMEIQDMRVKGQPVDRLVAVKSVLSDFIARRESDRMGLIVFGDNAYLQTPLTFDKKTLKTLLDETFIGIAGKRTSIGDAIGLALKRLQDRPSESKVLILLTDGRNTTGEVDPLVAAELAKQKGLKIYTVGVGADEIFSRSLFGFSSRRINPSADLDEKTLTQVAAITGGEYFRAKNTEELRQIYEAMDRLEPAEADPETFRPISSLFHWPLGIALLLTSLMILNTVIKGWIQGIGMRSALKTHSTSNSSDPIAKQHNG